MQKKAIVFDVDGVIFIHNRPITDTFDFIKNNYQNYTFFTNTTFSKVKLQNLVTEYDLGKYFLECLAYEDGTKKEKLEYIMDIYKFSPENILFIDDTQFHIDAVKSTGVLTLLFEKDGVSLEEKVKNIFGKGY